MRVRDVMRWDPVIVPPTATVAEARAAAEEAGVRHVVVAERSSIYGLLEEDGLWIAGEEVLRTAAGLQPSLTARDDRAVRHAMHPAAPLLSPRETVSTAARVMLLKRRAALAVVEGGALAGTLSVDELRAALGAPVMAVTTPEPVAARVVEDVTASGGRGAA